MKTTDKINEIHTKDNESKSLSTIVNLIDKKLEDFKNMMTATNHGDNDLFDNSKIANWSMQHENINFTPVTKGRNSILVKQTVDNDILEILRNSDKTNWDTLDAIRKELRSQGDTITEIKNHLATESVNPSNETVARPLEDILNCGQFISPLIESIYQTANDSSIHAESSIVADEPIITLTPSSLPLSGLMTGGNPDGMGTESLNLDSSAFRPESDSFSHPSSRLNSEQTASGNPGGMSTESQNLDSSAARPESGPTQTTTSTTNDNDVNLPSHNVTTSTDQIQLNSTTAIESQARHALSLLDNGSMADDHPIHLSEELYVSKFSNRTTCDDLKHYISRR